MGSGSTELVYARCEPSGYGIGYLADYKGNWEQVFCAVCGKEADFLGGDSAGKLMVSAFMCEGCGKWNAVAYKDKSGRLLS